MSFPNIMIHLDKAKIIMLTSVKQTWLMNTDQNLSNAIKYSMYYISYIHYNTAYHILRQFFPLFSLNE